MGYDAFDPYDVYDVPAPVNSDLMPNGPSDQAVSLADTLAVLESVGTFADDANREPKGPILALPEAGAG